MRSNWLRHVICTAVPAIVASIMSGILVTARFPYSPTVIGEVEQGILFSAVHMPFFLLASAMNTGAVVLTRRMKGKPTIGFVIGWMLATLFLCTMVVMYYRAKYHVNLVIFFSITVIATTILTVAAAICRRHFLADDTKPGPEAVF